MNGPGRPHREHGRAPHAESPVRAARFRLTDVSLTDGQGAVWAGAMTTSMVGAVVQQLAAARPAALEVCSPSTLRQCVARGEDPWQRLDIIRQRCPHTPLRAAVSLLTDHGHRGADLIATDVAVQWLRELAQRGVAEVLFIAPLLDTRRLAPLLAEATALGLLPIVALPFAEDAALSNEALCTRAAALAACGAARVMLRDESGVLTPDRLASLLPALQQALSSTPLDLHLGCQTALAPMLALEAMRLGIDGLDTAFAPLANGASVPALGTLVKSARLLALAGVDDTHLPAVDAASRALATLAQRHGLPEARPWAFSLAPYIHQLPGAVAAEFMERLDGCNLQSKLNEFAQECARVRDELGSPPMLAPFARPIAQQAWMHVNGLPRYAELQPGLRRVAQHVYGPTPGPVDKQLARRVGRLPQQRPQTMQALRAQCPGASDSALVLAQICGVGPDKLPAPAAPDAVAYGATTPTDALIAGLSARASRFAELHVFGPQLSVRLRGSVGAWHV